MIYCIFTPFLWATQGQWYSLANKETGSELARVFSISSQEAAMCEQGLLGTNPEAVSMLAGAGWPWVPVFSLQQASVSLFVKKKWSPRGDFYGPLSTLSTIWSRGGSLPVPWHPNSSNIASVLLFLWLLMPFYAGLVLTSHFLIWLPHHGDCFHAHLSDFRSTSQARRCWSTGSPQDGHAASSRLVAVRWLCILDRFLDCGSAALAPALMHMCSPWHSEVPQCQSWVRAERIAGAGPVGGWKRGELVEPGNILN